MKLRKSLGRIKRRIRQNRVDRIELKQYIKKHDIRLIDVLNNLDISGKRPALRICGNGMGIDSMTCDDSYDYLVVNYFCKSELFKKIKPKYYVVIDETPFVNDEYFSSMLVPIINSVNWEMYFFTRATFESEKINELFASNPYIHLVYWNCDSIMDFSDKNKEYCYDHNLAVPCVENVMVASIYIGIVLNYKRIELFGVNHDWMKYIFVDNDNFVRMYDQHFYEQETPKSIVYEKEPGVPIKMYEMMYMYAHIFKGYSELQDLAYRHGINIYNCTPGSYIDSFERK